MQKTKVKYAALQQNRCGTWGKLQLELSWKSFHHLPISRRVWNLSHLYCDKNGTFQHFGGLSLL